MLCCGSTAVLRAVVGPFAMLFGPPCRLRVLRGVVKPAMSSFGPQGYRWAHRVVVWDAVMGPTVSWLNCSRCCRPHRVAVRLLDHRSPHRNGEGSNSLPAVESHPWSHSMLENG